MKIRFFAAVAVSASVASYSASAQNAPANSPALEQVIVTATRAGEGVRRDVLGSSITIIEPVDLERRQTRFVSDVLRDVPGVAVNRSGTVGGRTQIRLRGTEGNHVLVLIDGMEAADPYHGEFDFAMLLADDAARVEVLRGQQSALYGSDAIGGVIHYMTATGKEAPGFRTRVEGGSFNTWEGAARFAGTTDTVDFAFSAGYQTTDGVPTSRFGTRDIGAESSVIGGKVEFAPTENFRVRAVTRYATTGAETNDQDFNDPPGPTYGYVIDSDDEFKNKAFYGLVCAELDSFHGAWRNSVSVQGVDAELRGYSDNAFDYGDDGSRLKATYVSTIAFGSDAFSQTLTGALDFERERMQNTGPVLVPEMSLRREIRNEGLVAQYDAVVNDRIGFGAAIRHDENDRFDNSDTYRLQGSYRFDSGTRLRAAAGSGIKNPSVTELFGYDPTSYIGNPDLQPEESKGWEVGAEHRLAGDAALIGVTYFNNRLENEIYTIFGAVGRPANRSSESTQKGIEAFARARFGVWSIDAAYTHLNAKENDQEEVRRPRDIASVNLDWRLLDDRAGLNLAVRYNGAMYDSNFTLKGPPTIRLSEYTLVNLGAHFTINDKLGIYGRVENLLDEEYEEVYTYRAAGRAAYLGFKAAFQLPKQVSRERSSSADGPQ